MMLFRALHAELLKLNRTLALILTILAPLAVDGQGKRIKFCSVYSELLKSLFTCHIGLISNDFIQWVGS